MVGEDCKCLELRPLQRKVQSVRLNIKFQNLLDRCGKLAHFVEEEFVEEGIDIVVGEEIDIVEEVADTVVVEVDIVVVVADIVVVEVDFGEIVEDTNIIIIKY